MWALLCVKKYFPLLLLFQSLCLLFFLNLPTPMFIPDPKFISDPRVISTNTTILKSKLFCHLKEDKTKKKQFTVNVSLLVGQQHIWWYYDRALAGWGLQSRIMINVLNLGRFDGGVAAASSAAVKLHWRPKCILYWSRQSINL